MERVELFYDCSASSFRYCIMNGFFKRRGKKYNVIESL